MLMLNVYSLFIFTIIQFLHLHCFNLDINHTIIYEDPSKDAGKRGSYFGFSLLLYSGADKTKSWIQIGAPRGNDSNIYKGVKEPGIVYRCPISDICSRISFDKIKSGTEIAKGKKYYMDQKNGAWIGGAMDIDENNGRVAVCGHRWRYAVRADKFDYMLGVCYSTSVDHGISDTSGVFKLIPLHKPDNYFHAHGDNPYYLLNYGVGQAGFSVHFPKIKGKPELLIGAPGVSNWKGSAVLYKDDNNRLKNDTFFKVFDPKSLYVEQYTLFGYQVNSGKFDESSNLYYVTGNPKGSNKGKVFLYTYDKGNGINILKRLDGYQTGEYFGSSLAVADINCDKIDDLIIGAPQYTINHDEGRIYIFSSNLQKTVFNSPTSIIGKIIGGRFGTTVTALGDLDKDGCDDIAVSAPYANNNTGVVYIYNGGSQGPVLSQEIIASKIDPNLKGFGISISRGADVDHNGYLDVAVGSYISDQAVLFRAQPVVSLNTSITAKVSELQRDSKYFVITVCLFYTGTSEHVPNTLHVTRNITVDEKLRRANFMEKRNIKSSSITIENGNHCEDIQVFLSKTDLEENTSDPISVKVTQEMNNVGGSKPTVVVIGKSSVNSNDGFREDVPVINEQQSMKIAVLNIPFTTECGDNEECEADLQLKSGFLGIMNGVYVVGSKSKLQLEVNVTNFNQPAYRTVVYIRIPLPIQLSSGLKNCKESTLGNDLLLSCNIGNPLRNGTLKSLILNLDTREVRPSSKNLTFYISVFTSSKDKNKVNNSQDLQLYFIFDADIIITGRSEELVYSYGNSSKTVFRHRYEVRKWGTSPIEVVDVELNIPMRLTGPNGEKFLDLYRPMAYLNSEQELACGTEENYEYHVDENMQRLESLDIDLQTNSRKKREVMQNEMELQTNETLFLNCSMPNVQCIKIRCSAGPFSSDQQDSASIELKMIMNVSNLGQTLGKRNTIHLSTQGLVSIKEPKIIHISKRTHDAVISTTFVNSTYTGGAVKRVATWIIALSIIAGIFLLMLIVIGFLKAGFFERKKKEELKSLMAIYATNVFTVGMAPKTQDKEEEDESACDSHDELKQEDTEEL